MLTEDRSVEGARLMAKAMKMPPPIGLEPLVAAVLKLVIA
jgi:hypothetical protein